MEGKVNLEEIVLKVNGQRHRLHKDIRIDQSGLKGEIPGQNGGAQVEFLNRKQKSFSKPRTSSKHEMIVWPRTRTPPQ